MERKIAVVTGGTGGIGTAICRRLATNYKVIACYFKNGKHDEVLQWQTLQKKSGYDIEILFANLVNFSDCEALANSIMERFGRIDILINNAGATCDVNLKKMEPHHWQQVIDANLTSTFNITRNVLPFMIEKNYGRIVCISSINGRKGQFGQCNYAATKSALFGFAKSLALEVANKGITVNTISPGYIETSMITTLKREVLDKITNSIPVGRLGKPEEIANAVSFLVGEEAGFITGSNLDINGGQYMGA
ncbi:acetoacetyl-CoA reductase [Fluoribacter gormanii]|uniref:3-oxoacyl-[acyl-carrier-protein] reductase n=1 Tax=Fluoribacter gormanii TaxID=464 RepID=A0A377GLG4_9GAMM|nr:acetoacetyl-CoA reductase [Fluoribacter gormanii]KTD01816.1 acetyoacetyl CoA reductase [Fluoribacter gormanii]MCW8442985.1 acetoacetyl-CoA reductase [Fluoribacter gormanii]MCW8471469.1 acetoacetyl-CoA reductase [Fluoribacter gormanii]SIR21678.1 3-oxoacyl-[acyl-carrier-protein] reductase [Fluoribacter gormanii]STO25413.1 3-oxoacyl-[acyl-carrier-protein] reductase FabG [Fluoribacter gormanii]